MKFWRKPLLVVSLSASMCWGAPVTVTVTTGPAIVATVVATATVSGCDWFRSEDHRPDKVPLDLEPPPDPKSP